ncbi:MAG: aldo/keto reductase [Clostridiaceae bacterium]|nr:aldo/keto reductase [Clostridiaceae bacterium]
MISEINFPDGRTIKNLGQGSWYLGDKPQQRNAEIEAIQAGIELGLTNIDTAEMYGNGRSETLIGEAIQPFARKDLFLISKVLPYNAGKDRIFQACTDSLNRLKTDYLDLYLLHWQGSVPLQETVSAMEALKAQGLIKGWGVSNFDMDQMMDLLAVENGDQCQTNQVLYHLLSRGVEFELMGFLQDHHIPMMAYCPLIGQEASQKKRYINHSQVKSLCKKLNITPTQLLLMFVTQKENVLAIPKAGSAEHVLANFKAWEMNLSAENLAILDVAFPAPNKKTSLHVE